MGKNKKVTKKVVGEAAANGVAREVAARKAAEIDALPAAGGELPAADAEGSAKGTTAPGGTGPPARSMLDDVDMEPTAVASGQAEGGAGGEGAAAPRPTIEQVGAEIRRVCIEAGAVSYTHLTLPTT